MKLLRSRFRFLSLLLACAFLAVVVLCAGTVLKEADISLPALPRLPVTAGPEASPSFSPSPDTTPAEDAEDPPSASPETSPEKNENPGLSPEPDPEYNVFGL